MEIIGYQNEKNHVLKSEARRIVVGNMVRVAAKNAWHIESYGDGY